MTAYIVPVTHVYDTTTSITTFASSVKKMGLLFLLPDLGTIPDPMDLENQTRTFSVQKVAVHNSISVILCTPEFLLLESFRYP